MKWNVVYRKNNLGNWSPIAFFMFHPDGAEYANRMNIFEPDCYQEKLEMVPNSVIEMM